MPPTCWHYMELHCDIFDFLLSHLPIILHDVDYNQYWNNCGPERFLRLKVMKLKVG